jgi:hypothetical protein
MGLRTSDLDGISLGLLDNWSRAQAKVELLDEFFARRGFLTDVGEPQAAAKIYFVALNSSQRALAKLAEHMHRRGTRELTLADYIRQNYGDETGA